MDGPTCEMGEWDGLYGTGQFQSSQAPDPQTHILNQRYVGMSQARYDFGRSMGIISIQRFLPKAVTLICQSPPSISPSPKSSTCSKTSYRVVPHPSACPLAIYNHIFGFVQLDCLYGKASSHLIDVRICGPYKHPHCRVLALMLPF